MAHGVSARAAALLKGLVFEGNGRAQQFAAVGQSLEFQEWQDFGHVPLIERGDHDDLAASKAASGVGPLGIGFHGSGAAGRLGPCRCGGGDPVSHDLHVDAHFGGAVDERRHAAADLGLEVVLGPVGCLGLAGPDRAGGAFGRVLDGERREIQQSDIDDAEKEACQIGDVVMRCNEQVR